jgi:CheY-like chemotaxis protein
MTKTNIVRTLVVEDMEYSLENIAIALRLDVLEEPTPLDLSGDLEEELKERGIDVAKDYAAAEAAIGQNDYGVVLLDHNLPRYKNGEPKNIGYSLIATIRKRNPDTTIIGTSSMSAREIRAEQQPNYSVDKSGMDLGTELKEVYDNLKK